MTRVTAAIALTVIGAAGFLILPVLLGSAVTAFSASEADVGLLGSMSMAGSVVSAVSALFWIRSVNWRIAARIALLLQLSGLVLAVQASSVSQLAMAFLLAGVGGGAVYSLALTVLSDEPQAERMFGYSVTGQVAFQVLGLLLLPYFVTTGGFTKLILALIALVFAGLFCTLGLPQKGVKETRINLSGVFSQRHATLALVGCALFFFNVGCVWAYVERIGTAAGFSPEQLGIGLAFGVSVGLAGALTAAWQGARWGYRVPLGLCTAATVVSISFLQTGVPLMGFISAVAAYNFFWNYSLTYQYALISRVDESGRCVAVAPAFHAAGAAAGPAVAAGLISPTGFGAVTVLAIGAVTLSLLFFAPSAKRAGMR